MTKADFNNKWEWMQDGYYRKPGYAKWRRLKVPWGWLAERTEDVIHDRSEQGQGMTGGWDFRVSVCFVFDPFHRWKP